MNRRRLLSAFAVVSLLGAACSAQASGGGATDEKKKGGGLNFIQIPTMTATIVRPDGRLGIMTVETGLDVPDTKLRAKAQAAQPRLRDAYAQFLRTYARNLKGGVAPNADYMSRELQRHTDQVLGKPGAKLLLGTILMN